MNRLIENILEEGKKLSVALSKNNKEEISLIRKHLFLLFDELCDSYLIGDESTRTYIRNFFHDLKGDLRYLISGSFYTYIKTLALTMNSKNAIDSLNRALTAAAIEDASLDFRDLLVVLGELYLAAERHSISPSPFFEKIAEIANPCLNIEKFSTQELLYNFSTSEYLKSIRPRNINTYKKLPKTS